MLRSVPSPLKNALFYPTLFVPFLLMYILENIDALCVELTKLLINLSI